jgi:hypothetical protein
MTAATMPTDLQMLLARVPQTVSPFFRLPSSSPSTAPFSSYVLSPRTIQALSSSSPYPNPIGISWLLSVVVAPHAQDVDRVAWHGNTALHLAAHDGRPPAVLSMLVAAGADVHTRNAWSELTSPFSFLS